MDNITSPLKAIRTKCIDCCCNQINEVKLCPVSDCPLHPFRFGKNPYRKRELTNEQKEALRQRLEIGRAKNAP